MVLIEEILDFPRDCLINNVIPKTIIFDEASLNSSDRDVFTKFVKQVKWVYKIDEDSLRVKPYSTDVKKYCECEILNVKLKEETFEVFSKTTGEYNWNDGKLTRIADILLRFIPYPTLLVFEFKGKIKLFVSHISESLADSSKITLDEVINTEWINLEDLDELDKNLFISLQLDNLDFTNVYTFYDSLISAIITYNGSRNVGQTVELDSSKVQEILAEINKLELEISSLRGKIKKEANFNRKVEYNIQIKKLKDKIAILNEELK